MKPATKQTYGGSQPQTRPQLFCAHKGTRKFKTVRFWLSFGVTQLFLLENIRKTFPFDSVLVILSVKKKSILSWKTPAVKFLFLFTPLGVFNIVPFCSFENVFKKSLSVPSATF